MFISKVVFEGVSEVKDTSRESQHKVTGSKKEQKQKGLFFVFPEVTRKEQHGMYLVQKALL